MGIDLQQALELGHEQVGVRQSRRIAQLKIKEEAERRKLEEEMVHETEHTKKKKFKKKDKDKVSGIKRESETLLSFLGLQSEEDAVGNGPRRTGRR